MNTIEPTETLYRGLMKLARATHEPCNSERHQYIKEMVQKNIELADGAIDLAEVVTRLAMQLSALTESDFAANMSLADHSVVILELSTHRTSVETQRSKAGFSSGEQRTAERQKVWDEWQRLADQIWEKNPRLSIDAVARRMAEQHDLKDKPRAIRNRIKKPPNK